MIATIRALLVIGLVVAATWAATTQPTDNNLLQNGSFETPGAFGQVGTPQAWEGMTMGTFPAVVQDCTVAHEGRCSIKIMTDKPVLTSIIQTLKLQPNHYYRLTGWVKTENIETSGEADAYGTLVVLPNAIDPNTKMIKDANHGGTTDWTRLQVEFQADATGVMNIICNFCGQGFSTGIMWFDDLRLEAIERPAAATATAPVDKATSPKETTTRPAAGSPE